MQISKETVGKIEQLCKWYEAWIENRRKSKDRILDFEITFYNDVKTILKELKPKED